jgi:hypothetical protein
MNVQAKLKFFTKPTFPYEDCFKKKPKEMNPNTDLDHNNNPYYPKTKYGTPKEYVFHRLGFNKLPDPFICEEGTTIHDVLDHYNDSSEYEIDPILVGDIASFGNHSKAYKLDIPDKLFQGVFSALPISALKDEWKEKWKNTEQFERAMAISRTENLERRGKSIMKVANANKFVSAMKECKVLDDIHFKKGGKGPEIIRLNTTEYPQPRRISWSLVLNPPTLYNIPAAPPHEEMFLRTMYTYSQSYRPMTDCCSVPMPLPVFQLGVFLWRAAYPYLSNISQVGPPTGCQLMVYHEAFGGKVGRHRDNGLVQNGKGCRTGNTEDENSQIRGSDVISYSVGDAMDFILSRPPEGKKPGNTKKKDYKKDKQ